MGARRMSLWLKREGHPVSRRIAGRWRRSIAGPARARCEGAQDGYLLKGREVAFGDEVWCADLTTIPMKLGFAYLVAVLDWKTRAMLGMKLSNTLEGSFCVEAFEESVRRAGRAPPIFNADQGCRFTSEAWIQALEEAGVRVSMDGKGRWMDNVFIERLGRSVKHEGVYL
jgi:putative transposase